MIWDLLVAALLLLSGLLTLGAALGLERLPDFFDRMHAPSLAVTLGSWSISLASIIHFSTRGTELSLHAWLIAILLAITAPVTTVLLARVGLFRGRRAGGEVPPPLEPRAPGPGANG
jgi:multicomponent K+:H+ antiporter subunit G